MIFDEEKMSAAVEYLAADPHPLAIAKKRLTDAENETKRAFARAVLAAIGGAELRKATATLDEKYIKAQEAEADAVFTHENQKAQKNNADMITDCWRTENANIRAAERVR